MSRTNSQLINAILIILGGGILLFHISGEKDNVYILILGLVMLMFGLFRATNYWVDTKDDHIDDEDKNSPDK